MDPIFDAALEAFKVSIDDKFIGWILSGHKNLTLSEAYQIALGIVKLDEIREAQTNRGSSLADKTTVASGIEAS